MKQKKFSIFVFSFLLAGLFPTSAYGDQINQTTNGNGNCPIIINGDNVNIKKVVCNENSSGISASENTPNIERANSLDSPPYNSGYGYKPIENPAPQISVSGDGYKPIQNPPPQI
ncbi:MAG: hypothetical protein AB4372_08120 [Xenococcus sp. (in: cyanobacteria)]